MKTRVVFFKMGRVLALCIFVGISGQVLAQVQPPNAQNDAYDTNNLTFIQDPGGYILNPDPSLNDNAGQFDPQAFYNTQNFVPQQQGTGIIQPAFDAQNNQILVYTPPPTFSGTAVFDYSITNAGGTDTAVITIVHGQQQRQPEATDDTYQAENLPVNPGPGTGEFTYTVTPSPFNNDTINTSVDLNQTTTLGFNQISGPGNFQAFVDVDSNLIFQLVMNTAFNAPVVVEYTLRDIQGAVISNTATLTINPPPQPATTDDTVDGDSLLVTSGPGTGETTYTLPVSPLANDQLNPPYDEAQTLAATDNFTLQSGTGQFNAFVGQNGPEFQYITNQPFVSAVTVAYNLRDNQGAVIANTDATITINPPSPVDAVDDTVTADDTNAVVDPVTGNVGYPVDPFANDVFAGQDPANLDLTQTLDPTNFVRVQGSGSIQANNNNGIEVIYYPEGAFTQAAVFDYTLYDNNGNTDNAQITINPPGTLPQAPALTRESDLQDACAVELANQRIPAVCQSGALSDTLLSLSTISAQADAMFGMQGDLISNIRQRMSENRSVYNPASVAGLNSNLFGKQVPIGRIVQELLTPLTGGGAADDFLDSGRLGFFLNGNLTAGDRDETGLTGGYDQDGYNFTTGFDYRVNVNFIVGAALGIANESTDFVADRGEQDADVTSFSFYGNYFPANSLYADFLLMMTQGSLDVDRNVSFGIFDEVARADTDGDLWSFAGTLGYHWNINAWELDGYSRVEYTDLQIDGYTETGSSFDLTVQDQSAESLEAALGFKVARVFSTDSGVVIPSLDLEWLGQFEDDARFIGVNMEQLSSGFAIEDEGADSSYFNAAFSLSSVFANGFSAYLRVESQFGDDHIGRATYGGGLRWEF